MATPHARASFASRSREERAGRQLQPWRDGETRTGSPRIGTPRFTRRRAKAVRRGPSREPTGIYDAESCATPWGWLPRQAASPRDISWHAGHVFPIMDR